MDQQTIIFIVTIIFILGIILILVFVSRSQSQQRFELQKMIQKNKQMQNEQLNSFQDRMSMQILQFQNSMTESVRNDLNRLNEASFQHLNHLDAKVNSSLMQGFEKTSQSFMSIKEQMARIDETQKSLKSLSSSIASLQNVMTDKKTRGTYGEVELYSLMKQVFGDNSSRWQSQYRLSNGFVADCVMFAPNPLGIIVIDSKFPLENYNRMYDDTLNAADSERIRNAFRRDVRKHINDITEKYIIPSETADAAYMFIPAEAIFAEIYGHFDDLVQYSYQKNVFIVSPTTLIAYLTAIRAIYLSQQRNDKVAEIQQEYIRLSSEFERFSKRFDSVESDFARTYKDMQEVQITSSKIINRFHDIEAVKLDAGKEKKEVTDEN